MKILLYGTLFISFLMVSCFSCAHFSTSSGSYDIKDAYASVGRLSVKSLDEKSRLGATGFAIDDEHIMSVAHFCVAVIEGNIRGTLPDKVDLTIVHNNILLDLKQVLEIVIIDEKDDICILQGNHGMLPLKFADYSKVRVGDKVSVIGAPLFMFPVLTEGRVAIPKMNIDNDRKLLFLGLHVSPGNSGSPVINDQGEVVGMIVMAVVPHIFLLVDTPFSLAQRGDILKRFTNIINE